MLADRPKRIAVKHAHPQQNPEKDWGRDVLNTAEFAFYVLNEQFGDFNGNARSCRRHRLRQQHADDPQLRARKCRPARPQRAAGLA